MLKYTNKSSQKSGSLNVIYDLKEGEEYHICSCLGSGGDEVELVGNIVVDGCWVGMQESTSE